jgi:hypothetical protein
LFTITIMGHRVHAAITSSRGAAAPLVLVSAASQLTLHTEKEKKPESEQKWSEKKN